MKNDLTGLRILVVLVLPTLACSALTGLAGATPTVWAAAPWISVPSVPAAAPTGEIPAPTIAGPSSSSTGDPYIDEVVSFTPGDPVNRNLGDTSAVLGPPDFNTDALTGFLNLGVGGIIVVKFVDNLAVDGAGNDIEVYGDPMNDEEWIVEASADCSSYKSFGQVGERASLDLATVGLASARCIRITDKGGGGAGATSPGTELDAIEALHSSAP
jgi:hypothetical protein